ncbi:MAG TPA: FAD-binding protein [Trebonia sp.]
MTGVAGVNGGTPALRTLPAVRAGWRRDADVVVVGSGAAGIAAALAAAGRGLRVVLVTKELAGGATPLAQGGLAAAIGPGDSAAAHAADTLTAGAGLSEPEVVAELAAGAPEAIRWVADLGARLEQRALHLEGGHSRHRVAHAGDATGAEVHRALRAALLASDVEILDRTVALDLILRDADAADRAGATMIVGNSQRISRETPRDHELWGATPARAVGGVLVAGNGPGGELDAGAIGAPAVVLAGGGLGQAFATTTNPPGATGDAVAIAARAGAVLRDPEFVQFHPTVLWLDGVRGQCPLITEALRGAGAVLRDPGGRPLMAGHHPLGDLAPRDVVAARMHEVISRGDAGHVWLDATALGRELLEAEFPVVTAACRDHGIDPVTQSIPVAPGAHYSCGGILAGLDGRTSIAGLYAAGEAASTGVHGANRLASNSVTEAIIAGRRAGEAIAARLVPGMSVATALASGSEWGGSGDGVSPASRAGMAAAMSRYAGVMRDAAGLRELVRVLSGVSGAVVESGAFVRDKDLDRETVEATNLHTVSALIAAAALRRQESRGCHRRRDAPGTAAAPWHTLVRWDGRRLVAGEEAL